MLNLVQKSNSFTDVENKESFNLNNYLIDNTSKIRKDERWGKITQISIFQQLFKIHNEIPFYQSAVLES